MARRRAFHSGRQMAVPTVGCLVAQMDFEMEPRVDCLVVLIKEKDMNLEM